MRSLSLPSRGAFHLSLSVLCAIGHLLYLALDHGRPCFKRNFTCSALLGIGLRGLCPSSTRLSLSLACFSNTVRLDLDFFTLRIFGRRSLTVPLPRFQQRLPAYTGAVWAVPFSLTTTGGISSISFPPGTEMFHFSGFLTFRCLGIAPEGLPHSETRGSMPACGSPRLFAACCVFRRQ